MPRHGGGQVVVDDPGDVERVLGLGPVAEHDGHRAERLHADAVPVHVADPGDIEINRPVLISTVPPRPRVPAVLLDRPEELPILHHVGLAHQAAAVVHADPAPVAVPLHSVAR